MKLLADFFPILIFFAAYQLYGIYIATGVAIAASLVQVGGLWLLHRRIQGLHLTTLGLMVVLGGLTIALQDRTFIMWKPSIVNWLFATVFLGSQLIGKRTLSERLMGQAVRIPTPIWRRVNLLWVAFFTLAGLANLYVASGFFAAEKALVAATGQTAIDLSQCAELYTGAVLELCQAAQGSEQFWVSFKLFGMLGLTMLFVVAQSFYLARYIEEPLSESVETH